jgi:RecA-family ATPase
MNSPKKRRDLIQSVISNIPYEPRDPVELIKDHLIADVVLLAGKKGTGKSQMVAQWTASFTDGKEFVPGVRPRVRGNAVIFNGERSIERTLVPRLVAAGVSDFRQTVHLPRVDTLEEAAKILEELIAEDPDIKIAFIDPLNAFLDGRSPTNAKARRLLKPLLAMCDRHCICVVLVHHFTKGGHKDLIDLISGSGGWSQAAGAIWIVARIKDSAILQHVECNDLPTEDQCYEYIIEPATLDPIKYKRRKRPTSRIVMLGKSSVDIQTALKLGKDMSGSCVPSAKLKIEQLLQHHGPMPSAAVIKHLEEQGITRATWKRAQDELQKEGRLAYSRDGRTTSWRLVEPEPDPKPEFHRDPETPESSESESHSEPPGSNDRFEEWGA